MTNLRIVESLQNTINGMVGTECDFWACNGYLHRNGNLIHKTESMVTCRRCNAISEINNLIKKITGKYYVLPN